MLSIAVSTVFIISATHISNALQGCRLVIKAYEEEYKKGKRSLKVHHPDVAPELEDSPNDLEMLPRHSTGTSCDMRSQIMFSTSPSTRNDSCDDHVLSRVSTIPSERHYPRSLQSDSDFHDEGLHQMPEINLDELENDSADLVVGSLHNTGSSVNSGEWREFWNEVIS